MTLLRSVCLWNRGLIPGWKKIQFFYSASRPALGTYTCSYSMGTRVLLPAINDRKVTSTTHPPLISSLGMRGANLHFYICFHGLHMGNFNLRSYKCLFPLTFSKLIGRSNFSRILHILLSHRSSSKHYMKLPISYCVPSRCSLVPYRSKNFRLKFVLKYPQCTILSNHITLKCSGLKTVKICGKKQV